MHNRTAMYMYIHELYVVMEYQYVLYLHVVMFCTFKKTLYMTSMAFFLRYGLLELMMVRTSLAKSLAKSAVMKHARPVRARLASYWL